MIRYVYNILYSLFLFGIVACSDSSAINEPEFAENDLIIDFSTGTAVSRATDEDYESRVTHLDVFVFEEASSDDDKLLVHYERRSVNESQGKIALSKKCDYFQEDAFYWVYVVANISADVSALEARIKNVGDLRKIEQTDKNIHLTALTHLSTAEEPVPATFLMDGVCFEKLETESDFDMPGSEPLLPKAVKLNDSSTDETVLKVILRRAAAKIKVKINAGDHVRFDNMIENSNAGYYLRNMPISTSVLPPQVKPTNVAVRRSHKLANDYFVWKQDGSGKYYIEITAYVYSHDWIFAEFFERGTSLIVDVPLHYNANKFEVDGETGELLSATNTHEKSYYQIMLRPFLDEEEKDGAYFERNMFYSVEVTIDAPGAEEDSSAEDIPELRYDAYPWTKKSVDVNGSNGPKYLKINQDTLSMFNVPQDLTTLYYTSSSKITSVKVVNNNSMPTPYYVDKFGVKTYVNPSSNGISAKVATTNALSGNLEVYSNIPTNNAICYFTVEITNADGLTESVVVEQSPVIYIKNSVAWFSYRDDFGGTTYLSAGTNRYVSVRVSNVNANTGTFTKTYSSSSGSNYGFFSSKVRGDERNGGNYERLFYYYRNNGTRQTDQVSSSDNVRNYHVTISATSPDYIVGRPRITNGITDPGEDNAKLVSPSFIVASRLGAIYSTSGGLNNLSDEQKLIVYADHCENYVEVVDDPNNPENINKAKVYDQWRLPTKAEIEIIIKLQGRDGQQADAIDYLLNGQYYFSASGPVYNEKWSSSGKVVRCVHDVF